VALALHELGRAPVGPDRLAGTTQASAGLLVQKLAPGRDDPCGVSPDIGHVRPGHVACERTKLRAQRFDLVAVQHDKGWFVRLDSGLQKSSA
jgi:hypothetical protein